MKYRYLSFALITSLLVVNACSTSEKASEGQSLEEIMMMIEELGLQSADTEDRENTGIKPGNSSLDLSNYLMRVPGVQITRSGGETVVQIRGVNSIAGENSPLFVVNGSRIGHNYSALEQYVVVDDINFINVLRGNEASQRYGSSGAAGAIEFVTK